MIKNEKNYNVQNKIKKIKIIKIKNKEKGLPYCCCYC